MSRVDGGYHKGLRLMEITTMLREIFFESCSVNLKSDCIYHFPIDLDPCGSPFGSESITLQWKNIEVIQNRGYHKRLRLIEVDTKDERYKKHLINIIYLLIHWCNLQTYFISNYTQLH